MYEISVDESFAAGHYLRSYKGKCENQHGHNYKVRITLEGEELDSAGLLCDFVQLKHIMQEVIRSLDHRNLNDMAPFDKLNPSAENIARYIHDETARGMRSAEISAAIASVTVWETETSAATYRPSAENSIVEKQQREGRRR